MTSSDYNSLPPEDGYSGEQRPAGEFDDEYGAYPEVEERHHDQLSPLAGVQQTASGELVPAPTVPPLGATVEEQQEYTLPSLPPEYGPNAQETIAEQLERQRAQLAQPAGNADVKGMPHFERMVDNVSLCGSCGESFPCEGWQGLTAAQQSAQPPMAYADASHPEWSLPTLEESARAAGVSIQEYMADLHRRHITGQL